MTISFAEMVKKHPAVQSNPRKHNSKFKEKPKLNLGSPQNANADVHDYLRETSHAKDRRKQRGVCIPKLHINDIYTHFKTWYQDGYGSKAQPKKVLTEFMNSQFMYRKNYYLGIKWNAVEDEEL